MWRNASIRSKILLLPLLALGALVLLQGASLWHAHDVLVKAAKHNVKSVTESVYTAVLAFEKQAEAGTLSEEAAQTAAKAAVRAVRYNGSEYFFAYNQQGVSMVHGVNPKIEGTSLWDFKDPNGLLIIQEFLKRANAGGGFLDFMWPRPGAEGPQPKIGYAITTPRWQWMVGTGVYVDDINTAFRTEAITVGGTTLVAAIFLFAASYIAARGLSRPIAGIAAQMDLMVHGKTDGDIPGLDRGDEIGAMANSTAVFREHMRENDQLRRDKEAAETRTHQERQAALVALAERFEQSVRAVVDQVHRAATAMRENALGLHATSADASGNAEAARGAAERASANVTAVAGAAEQLAASIQEISRQVAQGSTIASEADRRRQDTDRMMGTLSNAVQQVSDVVRLINDIAGQTNLLALNATIEAARAGDAGKGFAVVAGEVKNLASQTARATDDIQHKIAEIQSATQAMGDALQGIGGTITGVNEITATIAAAVEEQGASTAQIAENVQHAARSTQEVAGGVGAVSGAAEQTSHNAKQVLASAEGLATDADRLRAEVDKFLAAVRSGA